MKPIGYVSRASKEEDVKDRSLLSKVVIRKDLVETLEGIKDFSYLFIIFYIRVKKRKTGLNGACAWQSRLTVAGCSCDSNRFASKPYRLDTSRVSGVQEQCFSRKRLRRVR